MATAGFHLDFWFDPRTLFFSGLDRRLILLTLFNESGGESISFPNTFFSSSARVHELASSFTGFGTNSAHCS